MKLSSLQQEHILKSVLKASNQERAAHPSNQPKICSSVQTLPALLLTILCAQEATAHHTTSPLTHPTPPLWQMHLQNSKRQTLVGSCDQRYLKHTQELGKTHKSKPQLYWLWRIKISVSNNSWLGVSSSNNWRQAQTSTGLTASRRQVKWTDTFVRGRHQLVQKPCNLPHCRGREHWHEE